MSNKKNKRLLEEATCRRWMKLANLGPLTENFVKETFGDEPEEVKEETEEVEEVQTKDQARARGNTDRLMESPFVGEDDEGGAPEMGAPEMEMEPSAEEPADEATVKDLVAALAQAITSTTGVPVEVDGAASEPEEPGAEPEPEMEPAPAPEAEGQWMETQQGVNEEIAPTPKKTVPADPGTIKDPTKGEVKVQGAEKPEAAPSYYYSAKYKALEEQLVQRVLSRLVKEIKCAKVKKEGVSPNSPARVPANQIKK